MYSKKNPLSFFRLIALVAAFGLPMATPAWAEIFSLEQVPVGADITVPPSTSTTVGMGTRVKISSTDTPQTIHIVPIGDGSTFATGVQLAIFDSKFERVKYINVSPNAPFLYSFQGLASISILPSKPGAGGGAKSLRIKIESDKAVTFSR